MKPAQKKTARELLIALHEGADHDEAERAAMEPTDEEIERQLKALGYDPKEEHAKTVAAIDAAMAAGVASATGTETKTSTSTPIATSTPPTTGTASPSGRVIPLRPRLNRALVLPLAAGLIAASGAALYSFGGPWLEVAQNDAAPSSTTPLVPTAPPPPDPNVLALRRDGMDACRKMDWVTCQEKLTLANRLDPAGAKDPTTIFALDQAVVALTPPGDGGANPEQRAKQPDRPNPRHNRGPR